MSVKIKIRGSRSFAIKMAIGVILLSAMIGGLLRLLGDKSSESGKDKSNINNSATLIYSKNILVPTILLPVSQESNEKDWNEALTKQIGGISEVPIAYGRVDVMTEVYAIEIDFIQKWHEGLGQAIHYGEAAKKIGVLALIDKTLKNEPDEEHTKFIYTIERLCVEKGVKLIILRSNTNSVK